MALETQVDVTYLEKFYEFNLNLIENDFHIIGSFKINIYLTVTVFKIPDGLKILPSHPDLLFVHSHIWIFLTGSFHKTELNFPYAPNSHHTYPGFNLVLQSQSSAVFTPLWIWGLLLSPIPLIPTPDCLTHDQFYLFCFSYVAVC